MLSPRSASFTRLHEIFRGDPIVEHRRARGGRVQPVDHGLEIGRDIAIPVRGRIHLRDGRSAPP